MAKKKKLSLEELLEQALVKDEDKPYAVPENWVWTKIGRLCDVRDGTHDSPKYVAEGIPLVTSKNLKNGKLNLADINLISVEDHINISKRSKVNSGDILFAMIGTIGNPVLIDEMENQFSIKNVALFKKSQSVLNSKYLFYYLQTNSYMQQLGKKLKGSTQKFIALGNLRESLICFPPLQEQQRIVDITESLFEKLDRAKELAQHALDSFEDRKSAILHKAFTGELTRKWREENKIDTLDKIYETIKEQRLIITKNGKDKKDISELFDKWSLEDNLFDNGWIKLKAKMICDTITCGNTPTENISAEGEIPFLKVYNIVNNKIDFDYKPQFIDESTHTTKLKSSILQPNDIVMNIVGPPLRKIAIIPNNYPFWNMNQAIVRFRPIDYVDAKYLFYCLINGETLDEVINETKGVVGQANISITQSRNLEIPIPPIQEQQEIVRILDNLLANEQKAKELCNVIDKIDHMKKAILARAFRGELGTSNPDEESALELLKEVLKEKI